jgi:ZIP family zinc transporter
VGAALGWGVLAASSLVLGALLSFARKWSPRAIGVVLSFGAGALISAVSFELAEEGFAVGGAGITGIGLGVGALTYFGLDKLVEKRFSGEGGTGLALGAFLDGIPEQLVLGINLAAGQGVGVALLVAIFVSNLPESMGSAEQMLRSGTSRAGVLRLWLAVAAICAAATVLGYALANGASGGFKAAIDGFAGGALLVMLIDSMIPDARKDAGPAAGLVTVLGFALAAGLSSLS